MKFRHGFLALGVMLVAVLLLALLTAPLAPPALDAERGQPSRRAERLDVEPEPVLPDRAGRRRFAGIVRSAADGAPLPGAEVTLLDGEDVEPGIGRARTGVDGRFLLFATSNADCLRVRAPGFSPVAVTLWDDREEVEILLDRSGRVFGRVTRRSGGGPVAGAVVRAFRTGCDNAEDWLTEGRPVTTDDEGRYEFREIPDDRFEILVRGGGWVSEESARGRILVRCAPGGAVALDLVAVPAGRIRGRVRDDRGRPVRARLRARTGSPFHQAEGASDGQGRFVLPDLLPGRPYAIVTRGEGSAEGHTGPVIPLSGRDVDVEIRLPSPRFIDLLVLERGTGRPIEGATLDLLGEGPACSWKPSDGQGRIRVGPLRESPFELLVEHPEYVTMEERLRLESTCSGDLTIWLKKGLAILGTAVLPDGSLLPGGEVRAVSLRRAGGGSRRGSLEDGRFRLEGLEDCRHRVEVETERDANEEWWEGRTFAEAGAAGVVVNLQRESRASARGPTLLLSVLDTTGHAVPRASVRVTTASGRSLDGPLDEVLFGRVEIEYSGDPGTVVVEVEDPMSLARRPLDLAPRTVGPIALPTGELTIVLEPGRRIEGRVRDGAGRGVADLTVEARALSGGEPNGRTHRSAETGPDGAFHLVGLGEGTHRVWHGYHELWKSITRPQVVEAGAVGVVILVERVRRDTITVLDPTGEPVTGAYVDLRLEDAADRNGISARPAGGSGTSGANGVVKLDEFEDGATYRAMLEPPRDRRDLIKTWRSHVRPGDRIAFDAARYVTARIDGAEARDVGGLVVWGRIPGRDHWTEGRLTGEGAFSIGPFPAGDVELLALRRGVGPGTWAGSGTMVEAGTESVRLAWIPPRDLRIRVFPWPAGTGTVVGKLTLGDGRISHSVASDAAGVFRFEEFEPGVSATFWVGPVADGRFAWRRGIAPHVHALALDLRLGRTVTGRIESPCAMRPDVSLKGPGFSLDGSVRADGTFEIRGVPPGEWTVCASSCVYVDGHQHSSGEARVVGDRPVVIRMSAPE